MKYYPVMARKEGIFYAYYQVKKAKATRLHILCFQPTSILEKAKLTETVKDLWWPGVWRQGGVKRQSTDNVQDSETTLQDTAMQDTCYCICQTP